jgi:hypothetical protein
MLVGAEASLPLLLFRFLFLFLVSGGVFALSTGKSSHLIYGKMFLQVSCLLKHRRGSASRPWNIKFVPKIARSSCYRAREDEHYQAHKARIARRSGRDTF